MIQLTSYQDHNKIINTEYGSIKFDGWIKQERDRLAQQNVDAKIKYKHGVQCALYVDDRGLELRDEKEELVGYRRYAGNVDV